MTFDEYCEKTGRFAENGDRALWAAATAAATADCATSCLDVANKVAVELTNPTLDTYTAARLQNQVTGAMRCYEMLKSLAERRDEA